MFNDVAVAARLMQAERHRTHRTSLQVVVVDKAGMNEWALEMGGSGQLAQRGWTSSTFKPGDKITVNFHPSRDGSNGGQFVSVAQLNGQLFESRSRGD